MRGLEKKILLALALLSFIPASASGPVLGYGQNPEQAIYSDKPSERKKPKVLIDPGHYPNNGTSYVRGKNSLAEHGLTLKVGELVRSETKDADVELTREGNDYSEKLKSFRASQSGQLDLILDSKEKDARKKHFEFDRERNAKLYAISLYSDSGDFSAFVSIHFDQPGTRGYQVYVSPQNPEKGRELAEFIAEELAKISYPSKSVYNDRGIGPLKAEAKRLNRMGIGFREFVVTGDKYESKKIPSVLAELGGIDTLGLAKKEKQKLYAGAVSRGVINYLKRQESVSQRAGN